MRRFFFNLTFNLNDPIAFLTIIIKMGRNLLLIKEFNWDLAFCFWRMGQMTSSRIMVRLMKSIP